MQITKPATSWWFWVLAVAAVLWNLIGVADYLGYTLGGEAYLDRLREADPAVADYMASMPAWRVALWALGVWGSLAGAVLLVARRRWSVPAYVVGLVGIVVGLLLDLLVSGLGPLYHGVQLFMSLVIVVLALLQLWFARAMQQLGLLR